MDEITYDVVSIGNALVDVLTQSTDDFLAAQSLAKGGMALIDVGRADELYEAMGPGIEASGGSAANTVAGIASFGGKAAFVGRVFDDQLGMVYAHDLKSIGAGSHLSVATDGPPTGRCLILVTPDGERTMNTFLGAAAELDESAIDEDVIADAQFVYLEGYLFDQPVAKKAYWKASQTAEAAGVKVALTLSDTFCVERHRDEWVDLVKRHVDVLFANEGEIEALFQLPFDEAIDAARAEVDMAFVTRGAAGAVIVAGGQTITVEADPVDKVVDTTGAGDLYAAGVLIGLSRGLDLETCGRLGSLAAAEVISHIGPRPATSLLDLAGDAGLL